MADLDDALWPVPADPPGPEDAILEAALALSPTERAALLDRACGGDAALRRLVEALLRAHGHAAVPREPTSAHPSTIQVQAGGIALEQPGDRIGRYKLLQQIGVGGYGVVYMAEQEEPVRRRVALKVIKLGMDTRQVVARFEAERQALALMDHPNIARVLDAGATATGRPFFVMELVRGIKVTDYCDQNNLPTAKRLELFVQVCKAIQHAHQKGIIHRDIKPSNILVTLHDGVPVPKVIDFGIAKATEQRLTDKTLFTALEQFMGTPAYMSPEQAEMSGLDIDTRSDIYSLGVLLYELLTGKVPFEPKELAAAGLDELRRLIREKDPVRPSTRLNNLSDVERTTVASRRQTEPPKLIHLVRGDLDWIVMKCLEKDRTRRYETANGLARDVERHLANEAVLARRPSKLYRFEKLVRRHKLGFAAAGAVLAALVAGLGLSTVLFIRERAARRETVLEADKSRQVAELLKGMLQSVSPKMAKGQDTALLRQLLDQTTERIRKSLVNQPEAAADLLLVVGRTYEAIGQYTNALAAAQDAASLFRARFGPKSIGLADALSLAGAVAYDMDDSAGAERFGREALALRRQLLGNGNVDVATSLNNLGNLLFVRHDLAGAEAMHREALAIRVKALGSNNLEVAMSFCNLANVAAAREELAQAENLTEQALAITQSVFGRENTAPALLLNNLGSVRVRRGDLPGAAAVQREALEIRRKLLGNHADVAVSLTDLGTTLAGLGDLDSAEKMVREALVMEKTVLSPDHRYVPDSLEALGIVLGKKGDLANAEAAHRDALAMRQRVFGPDDPTVADSLAALGLVIAVRGDFAQAQTLLSNGVDVRRKLHVEHDPELAGPLWQLAWVRRQAGDASSAETARNEALSIVRQDERKAAPLLLDSIFALADLLQGQGRTAQTEPLLLEAAEHAASCGKMEALHQRRTLERLAHFYAAWDKAAPDPAKAAKAAEWEQRLAQFDIEAKTKP